MEAPGFGLAESVFLFVFMTSYYSPARRRAPSTMECQPYTTETMNPSICRSPGALSSMVDLYPTVRARLALTW